MNVGQTIKQLRKEANLSQSDLAGLANIDSKSISPIEAGKTEPRVSTVAAIARGLNIPVAVIYVLSITEDDIPVNSRSNELYMALVAFGKDILIKGLKG